VYRRIKYELIKVIRAHASAHEIAYGAAVGAFISIFPTFGASTFLVILLYRVLKFNLVAAVSGSLISNLFTAPFFLLLSYKIGALIWGTDTSLQLKTWYKHLDELGLAIFTGSLILSTVCSIIVYFAIKRLVVYYRKNKMRRPPENSK
jgi:uncharacterized protein (DUF2062 family)